MKTYTIAELAEQIEKACTIAERLDSIENQLRAIRSAIEATPRAISSPHEAPNPRGPRVGSSIPKSLYTLNDAACALSVCRATVIELVKQGFLRATKIGRLTRIHRSDVEKLAKIGVPSVWGHKPWLEERKNGSNQ